MATAVETVELPPLLLYRTPHAEVRADPAFARLDGVSDAALLIEERNALRRRLQHAEAEFESERKLTRLYATHLQELIVRVRRLPQGAELLTGLQNPRRDHLCPALSDLLQDLGHTHSTASRQEAAGLPIIDSYLTRTLEKAQKSLPLLAALEMTQSPASVSAWKTLEQRLTVGLDTADTLVAQVRTKAEAVNAAQSIEAFSLAEAGRCLQRLKSVIEDLVVESEGWVVTEAMHGRVEPGERLRRLLQRRLTAMAQPLTLSAVQELADIHAEYELLRKSAALRPWADRVRPDAEWWHLVTLCTRLAYASEATVQKATSKPCTELSSLIDRLRRELGTDSEGVYTFATAVLDGLLKVERQKAVSVESQQSGSEVKALRKSLKETCAECLNLALSIATGAAQPTQEWMKLRRDVESPQGNTAVLASSVVAAARRLQGTLKTCSKAEWDWALPVLEKCLEAATRRKDDQSAQRIRTEVQAIKEDRGHGVDHREEVAALLITSLQRDTDSLDGIVNEAADRLQSRCLEIARDHQSLKPWAEEFSASMSAAVGARARVRTMGEVLTRLRPVAVEGGNAANIATTALGADIKAVVAAAAEFLERTGRAQLAQECRQASKSDSAKLRLLSSVLSQSASPEVPLLARILETTIQKAQRLVNSSSDPDNRLRAEESLLRVRRKKEAGTLVEALADALDLERKQADFLNSEGFEVVDIQASASVPVKPAKRVSETTTLTKDLSEGLQHLLSTAELLRGDLRVRLDETQYSKKLSDIQTATTDEKPLLQEALLHWILKTIQSSVATTHRRLLEKAIASLEHIAQQKQSSELLATVAGLKEDKTTLRRPLLRLLEEAQDAVNQELQTTDSFATEEVWASIQQVVRVYEAELQTHSIQLTISEQEEEAITSSDPQIRARGFLHLLAAGMRAVSGRLKGASREAKHSQAAAAATLNVLTQALRVMSEPEASRVPTGSTWTEVEKTAITLRALASSFFEKINRGRSTLPMDIQSWIEHSKSLTPESQLLIEQSVSAATESALKLLDLRGSTDLQSAREQMRSVSIPEKLDFVQAVLAQYRDAATATFGAAKRCLTAAVDLQTDDRRREATAALATLAERAGNGAVLDATDGALSALWEVLNSVRTGPLQGLETQLRIVREIADTVGVRLDPSAQAANSESTQELQSAALQSALAALHSAIQRSYQELTASLVSHARSLNAFSPSDFSPQFTNIENTSEAHGGRLSLVLSIDRLLSELVEATVESSRQGSSR